jgi:hypothetical protein
MKAIRLNALHNSENLDLTPRDRMTLQSYVDFIGFCGFSTCNNVHHRDTMLPGIKAQSAQLTCYKLTIHFHVPIAQKHLLSFANQFNIKRVRMFFLVFSKCLYKSFNQHFLATILYQNGKLPNYPLSSGVYFPVHCLTCL